MVGRVFSIDPASFHPPTHLRRILGHPFLLVRPLPRVRQGHRPLLHARAKVNQAVSPTPAPVVLGMSYEQHVFQLQVPVRDGRGLVVQRGDGAVCRVLCVCGCGCVCVCVVVDVDVMARREWRYGIDSLCARRRPTNRPPDYTQPTKSTPNKKTKQRTAPRPPPPAISPPWGTGPACCCFPWLRARALDRGGYPPRNAPSG